MQINEINEIEIGKNHKILILMVFPLSIFMCGLFTWLFEANFSLSSIAFGLKNIVLSPTTLYTDFLEVGGISSALFNATIIGFYNLYLLKKYKLRINGLLIAAFFTITGFSFFGKNIFNIIPIYIGGFFYSKYQSIEYKDIIIYMMFGTALAPVISLISFSNILPMYYSLPLGIIAGIFIGFVIVPLSTHMLKFHEGYNIYNIGFTAGIIGTVLTSILKSANIDIESANILYNSNNNILLFLLLFQFLFLFVVGILINKKCVLSYKNILKYKGRTVTDFTFLVGYGITFFNMGILGLLSLAFVIAVGGVINGPVIAAIFSVVGFGAFGKHIGNCFPVALGVLVFALLFQEDISSTSIIITILFSTTIAPIAGSFGFIPGIIAGMLHFTIASNISIIHGGLNLYNNGFAGGLVAGFLVPIIEAFKKGEK